jgi:hypothetical protein
VLRIWAYLVCDTCCITITFNIMLVNLLIQWTFMFAWASVNLQIFPCRAGRLSISFASHLRGCRVTIRRAWWATSRWPWSVMIDWFFEGHFWFFKIH